jgi:FtsZ-binding cell division protein ZapB
MNYELHPLCTLFPRLSGNEYQNLVEDIKKNGLMDPIILHDNMILDGGNRYRACIDAGVEPEFMKFGGANIVSYVLSVNLHRRHLSPGQQAAIVSSAQDWAKAQSHGGDRKSDQAATLPLETVKDRASQSGASERTQRMADKVVKAAPDLAKSVAHGEISLPKALKQISPQQEPAEKYDPKETELSEAHDTINYLESENEKLRDALAAGQLPDDEIVPAEQLIIDLRRRIAALEAELDAVKSSRDIYQRENNELKTQCKMYQGMLKKAGKC